MYCILTLNGLFRNPWEVDTTHAHLTVKSCIILRKPSFKMSGDGSLYYQKMKKLTPETLKEEKGEIYSSWRHDYDKVSAWLRSIALLRNVINTIPKAIVVPCSVTGKAVYKITTAI